MKGDPEKKGDKMITLHRLNDDEFCLNSSNIEIIEEKPDTTITLTNERKYIVKESMEEVIRLVLNYQKKRFLK